jgi:hypothetical protein
VIKFSNIRREVSSHLLNIRGTRVGRKIIVIESDDWGSIRMSSRDAYESLEAKNVDVSSNPFNKYDGLESEQDIKNMYDVLSTYKDVNGKPPIITTNFIVANPDFEKIRACDFNQYFFESFLTTYAKYPNHKNSFSLIGEGIKKGFIYPQYHGREHLNVVQWMKLLQAGHNDLRTAFDYSTFGIELKNQGSKRSNLMATFDYINDADKQIVLQNARDGYSIFQNLFGFPSQSFIAPCYVWDGYVEQELSSLGVKFIQSALIQNMPSADNRYTKKYRTIGDGNSSGQTYLVRNAYFEPSTRADYDWIGNCEKKIEAAFFWGKPAIISMHRLNFIGSIFPENAEKNLNLLSELLKKIINRWPSVEFMTSVELGELLVGRNKHGR